MKGPAKRARAYAFIRPPSSLSHQRQGGQKLLEASATLSASASLLASLSLSARERLLPRLREGLWPLPLTRGWEARNTKEASLSASASLLAPNLSPPLNQREASTSSARGLLASLKRGRRRSQKRSGLRRRCHSQAWTPPPLTLGQEARALKGEGRAHVPTAQKQRVGAIFDPGTGGPLVFARQVAPL